MFSADCKRSDRAEPFCPAVCRAFAIDVGGAAARPGGLSVGCPAGANLLFVFLSGDLVCAVFR